MMLGTKVENLKKLKEKNFNIPNFFVIRHEDVFSNHEVFENILNASDGDLRNLSRKLKDAVEENIKIGLNINFKYNLYSVRSSSSIEDGTYNSFAGQFDTFLNVKEDELLEKIKLCFKSLYNENVLEYMQKNNLDFSILRMNVIVQEMIVPDYSGVLFTSNPQGIINESVIVVGQGVGENVVQDKVDTTSYYYNLTDKVYYYEGRKDYLSLSKIEELIDISLKIQDILGEFLDIEFAILNDMIYILQARKITTIDAEMPLILDNSNIVESYPGISLPLTCSFVNSVYSGVFKGVSRRVLKNKRVLNRYNHVFSNMVGNANGRLYYKISNWYAVIKFLPFNKKIIPVWQEMLGVKNKTYAKEKIEIPFFTRVMTYINSMYELVSVPKNMDKLNLMFIQINDYFYSKFNEDMHPQDIVKLYDEVEEKILSIWDITLLNDMYSFIFTGLLKNRLKKKYDNYEEIANNYISGISNIESLKPIKEMINLAYDKNKISNEEYKKRFEYYIKVYGDRNLEELKLESETFRTKISLLEQKVVEYNEDYGKLKRLYNDINMTKESNLEKEDKITKFLAGKCTRGIKNREISRLNRSRIYGMVRTMFLSIGKFFENNGVLEKQRDIFYLTLEEVFENVNSLNDLKEIIELRKKEYEIYKLLPSYSRIIFSEKEFNKSHNSVNSNKVYLDKNHMKGIPCSSGIVEAEAVVIEDINNVGDVKDKILITKMTDPGWVFLLATAKGIISEKGSLLSHTAIISRELKIPSIVGVENVLDIIKTGDIIRMDASTGMIEIVNKIDELING